MAEKKISLALSAGDQEVGYVYLPGHPGPGASGVAKQVRLSTLLEYKGPDLFLDFDGDGQLVGVEILA
jgi:hypothetical protein